MSEKEKKDEKEKTAPERSEHFNWKNGTTLEKVSFVATVVALTASITLLVFEFTYPEKSWPYAWFDVAIGLSFAFETLTQWRLNRRLAFATALASALFLICGILKVFGVVSA